MKNMIWKKRRPEITKWVPFTAIPTSAPSFSQHSAQNPAGYPPANTAPEPEEALFNGVYLDDNILISSNKDLQSCQKHLSSADPVTAGL